MKPSISSIITDSQYTAMIHQREKHKTDTATTSKKAGLNTRQGSVLL